MAYTTVITDEGQQALAKAVAGEALLFSRMVLSKVRGNDNSLGHETMATNIDGAELSGTRLKLSTRYINSSINIGFWIHEIGIYVDDPTDGEILFSISSTTSPDYMPAHTEHTLEEEISIYIETGATDLTTVIGSNVFVTRNELDAKVDKKAGKDLSSNDYTDEDKDVVKGLKAPSYSGELTNVASVFSAGKGVEGEYVVEDSPLRSEIYEGLSYAQQFDNANVPSTITFNGHGNRVQIRKDGTLTLDNSFNENLFQTFKVKADDVINAYIKIDPSSTGLLDRRALLLYSDGTIVIGGESSPADDYETNIELIAVKDGLVSICFVTSSVTGSVIRDYQHMINKTAQALSLSEEQLLIIHQNGYIDGLQNTEGIKVISEGSNIVNYKDAILRSSGSGTIEFLTDGIKYTGNYYFILSPKVKFEVGSRYTLTFDEKIITAGAYIRWNVQYTDGTFDTSRLNGQSMKITKEVRNIVLYSSVSGEKYTVEFRKIRLNKGNEDLGYIPYKWNSKYLLTLGSVPVAGDIFKDKIMTAKTNVARDGDSYRLKRSDILHVSTKANVVTAQVNRSSFEGCAVFSNDTDNTRVGKYNAIPNQSTDNLTDKDIGSYLTSSSSNIMLFVFPLNTSLEQARGILEGEKINYELDVYKDYKLRTSKSTAYKNGRFIVKHATKTSAIYNTGIALKYSNQAITKVIKIHINSSDSEDFTEVVIDLSTITISNNLLTSSALSKDDLVYVEYDYKGSSALITKFDYATNEEASRLLLNQKVASHDTFISYVKNVIINMIKRTYNKAVEALNKAMTAQETAVDALEKATTAQNTADTKEPVFDKNTGFNLDKSDSVTSTSSSILATSKAVNNVQSNIDNMVKNQKVNPVANSILKRGADGNIRTKNALFFENDDSITFDEQSNIFEMNVDGGLANGYIARAISATQIVGNNYIAGGLEKPNSSVFGPAKMRNQMLNGEVIGASTGYYEALWMSSYNGADVKGSPALFLGKQSEFAGFALQDFDSGTWGPLREFYHTGNDDKILKNTSHMSFNTGVSSETITNPKICWIRNMSNPPKGYDPNANDFILTVKRINNENWVQQQIEDVHSGRLFVNRRIDGTWYGWSEILIDSRYGAEHVITSNVILTVEHMNKTMVCSSDNPITITLPVDENRAYNPYINIINIGTGKVTFANGSGFITVFKDISKRSIEKNDMCSVFFRGTSIGLAFGPFVE